MILLSGIKPSMESQPKLISTDKNSTTTKLPQMLQNLQVIVGLNSIPNNGAETLQCLVIGLKVSSNLGFTVEIERPLLNRVHDFLDLDALTVKKPI